MLGHFPQEFKSPLLSLVIIDLGENGVKQVVSREKKNNSSSIWSYSIERFLNWQTYWRFTL